MLAFRMQSGWLMMRTGNQAQSWQGAWGVTDNSGA